MGRSKICKAQKIIIISAHAEKLFIRYGYNNTSMTDVATSLNIRKASLYHYFPSRKMLTKLVVERIIASFQLQYCFLENTDSPEFKVEHFKLLFELNRDRYFLLMHLSIECRYIGYVEIVALIDDFFLTTQMAINKIFLVSKKEAEIFLSYLHDGLYSWHVFVDKAKFYRAFHYLKEIHDAKVGQAAVL